MEVIDEIENFETRIEHFDDLRGKITQLSLDNDRCIFRGHSNSNWTLKSSLVRFLEKNPQLHYSDSFKILMSHYVSGCLRIGKDTSNYTGREIFEIARHDGLPSPLIDFTYSPYIALYFSLSPEETGEYSVVNIVKPDVFIRIAEQ